MKRTLALLLVAWIVLGAPHRGLSQITGGNLSGDVRNQAKEPVTGAKVTVRSLSTNQTRSTITDSEGAYRISSLPVGLYELTVDSETYAQAVRQFTIRVDENAKVSVDLVLAGSQDVVQVVGSSAPITESSNSVLGIVIENKQITDLPLNGRNFLQLGTLVANVTSTASLKSGAEGGILNGPFAVAGQRDRSLTFLVDGVDNNNSLSNSLSAQVSVDAIQEFKLVTNLGAAEHGYHSGGIVNIVTKAGTNDLHFSVFEFFRNRALNSRNHFEKVAGDSTSAFNNNQFGGTASGPIIENKTFFLLNYEGQRLRTGNTQFSNVPTEDQRRGIFRNAAGQITTVPVDPVSARIMERFIPHPNVHRIFGNYLASPTIKGRNDFGLVKVEHLISGSDEISGRYFVSDNRTFDPIITNVFLSTTTPPSVPGFGLIEKARTQNVALMHTHTFNNQTLSEVRFGYNRHFNFLDPEDNVVPAELGFVNVPSSTGLFDINLTGISRLGNNVLYPLHFKIGNYHLADSFSFVRGRHAVKIGSDVRWLRMFESLSQAGAGSLSFSGLASRISPLADFVMGVASLGTVNLRNIDTPLRQNNFSGFAQDDYQVTNRLVLNYGLRYELNTVLESPANRLTNYSIARGLFTPGVDTDTGLYRGDHNNFAPRLGFALTVTKDGRTVMRGGYGVYYDAILFTTAVNLNLNQVDDPLTGLSLALPGQKMSTLFRPSTLITSFGILSPRALADNLSTPYAQHFNLILQREFGGTMLASIGYVGTKSTKLIRSRDINQAVFLPGLGSDGKPLSTSTNITDRRPTQLFGLTRDLVGAIIQEESSASSIYHSFQATLTKRLSRGLSILSAYTWSKSIDDATDPVGFTGDVSGPQNSLDLRQERGPSVFDSRHRLTLGYTYSLPFKGNRWVDGWQVNGTTTLQSGQPYSLLLGFDRSLTASLNPRPNVVPGAFIQKGGQLFFNPDLPLDPVRKIPSALIPENGQFGNLGRNTFVGDGYYDVDVAVVKQTNFREKCSVQTRLEVFNLFDGANLALPQRRLTDPFFGLSRKTQDAAGGLPGIGGGGPRVVQLVLKISY